VSKVFAIMHSACALTKRLANELEYQVQPTNTAWTRCALLPTPMAVAGYGFTSACLCVCLFFRTISQKPMQLRSPNFTQKGFKMSFINPFILGSKVKVTSHKNVVGLGLCTLVSADFFWLLILGTQDRIVGSPKLCKTFTNLVAEAGTCSLPHLYSPLRLH